MSGGLTCPTENSACRRRRRCLGQHASTPPHRRGRDLVRSTGVAARGVNLFGYAVAEFDYVHPFDRPGRGWLWEFNLRPGF